MELANFFKVLMRYKKTLILVPLISAIVTFVLMGNLPKTYRSTSRIATGLVERSDEFINKNALMESKISQEFSNIIQMMLLKKVVNQVSYQLMIHDLSQKPPYRKQSSLEQDMNDAERKHAIDVFSRKYSKMEELSLWDKDQNALNKLLVSKKYDYESLTKKLNAYRLQTSDYIYLDFESENPMLSAFILNTLSKEFINYYTSIVNQKKERTITYLDSSLKVRQASLTAKMMALKNYKIKNRILDVNNQANVLMTQIADFQSKRQEAEKNITAYGSVLNNIDAQLDPKEKKTLENSLTKSNQDILATRNRLNALNDEYIKSNFDVRYKTKIDSLQNALTANINDANDKRTSNIAVNVKPDLVKEKLNTEINLEMAKNSVASLDNMVNSLTSKLNVLAPNQANIQASEKEIENESREYVDLVNKFNQTKLESSFPIRLRQVEMAMPEIALPSRRIIMVILGGIVSFLFAVGVLFLMFYFDHSINNAQELADGTQQPVLGTLSIMRGATLDPHALWEKTNDTTHLKQLKSQLRSIRFEIDNDLADSKIIAVTSLQPSEGKTFLALNLAYAYKMINKRVLLIDGNFDNPTMREILNPDLYLEDFLLSNQNVDEIFELDKKLVVMGNKGEDVSLLEISNHSSIQSKLQVLRDKFDIILIEISSLDTFNKAREWISFSDKVVPVFAAGQNITKGKKKEIDYLSSLNGRLAGWVMNKVVNENVTSEKPKAAKKSYA